MLSGAATFTSFVTVVLPSMTNSRSIQETNWPWLPPGHTTSDAVRTPILEGGRASLALPVFLRAFPGSFPEPDEKAAIKDPSSFLTLAFCPLPFDFPLRSRGQGKAMDVQSRSMPHRSFADLAGAFTGFDYAVSSCYVVAQ
jgi:hypothetical protein